MPLQELQIYGLWAGKQTAKGTPNSAPGRRFRQTGGKFDINRDDGSENYSDATAIPDSADWVNSLIGNGSPVIQATPDELAWLNWTFEGGESTSAVAVTGTATTTLGSAELTLVNPTTGWVNGMTVTGAGIPAGTTIVSGAGTATMVMSANASASAANVAITGSQGKTRHTVTPLPGLGHWHTWVTRQGSSVIDRHQHNDALISQLVWEGSTANKAVKVTPTVMALDPGQTRAGDPAPGMPGAGVLLYTDGTGRFTIDGTTFRGHSQFTLTVNKDLSPVYGDAEVPHDFAIGNVVVTIGVTLYFDADGRAQWNKIIYGTATPAAGAKPARFITGIGSYSFDLRARSDNGDPTGNAFKLTIPKIKWAVPDAPGPNPDGGTPELGLAGAMRKPAAGTQPYTIDVDCDAAAFTA